jgi:hypothetical protein
MSSRGKKKTTMAKLSRESRLRERRQEKAARKDARRYAAENPSPAGDELTGPDAEIAAGAELASEDQLATDDEFAAADAELAGPVTAAEPDPA